MKKETVKKILLWAGGIFVCLVLMLAVHIYLVTRPKAPDANTRIMARLDIKQPITQEDADHITSWLYDQKGIDHVLVNPKSQIAIFTFAPIKTNGDEIAKKFTAALHYDAVRYMPSEEEMMKGCPVKARSITAKVYKVFTHIF